MTESAGYQPKLKEVAPEPSWKRLAPLASAMMDRLEECRRERAAPPVEAVHRLRTGTRRLEATLELVARQAGPRGLPAEAQDARQQWLRQLKKIRRAAGAVRDLDVHRELLAEAFLSAGPGADPAAPLTEQARSLDVWLSECRKGTAAEMVRVLDHRATRLLAAEHRFLAKMAALYNQARAARRSLSQVALEDYLRLVDAIPLLDRENLHDFRKGAKKARYMTEFEPNAPVAAALGRVMKRAQDAIGVWHDWDVLAAAAQMALGKEGALQQEFVERARQAYARALRITDTTNRRLIGEWRALHLHGKRQTVAARM